MVVEHEGEPGSLEPQGFRSRRGGRPDRRFPEPAAMRAVVPEHRAWGAMDLLRIVIAILLPPLGVFLQVGLGRHFWLNILLTLLGYIPGIVHAVWIIARR